MQGFASQQYRRPAIAKLRSQSLVQLDRLLVPVKHFPSHPVTLFLNRNVRHLRKKRPSDPAFAKLFSYKQIFQEHPTASPRGKVGEEERISRRMPVPLSDQSTKLRMFSKSVSCKLRFLYGYLIEFTLEIREFANHCAQ